jgi:4-amino-4-deoxy-L-arabinose transferase-like glycosyltransferase
MGKIGALVKEFGWLGTVIAAVATSIWAVATYLNNAKRDYVKDFNTKQINTFFETAETVFQPGRGDRSRKVEQPRSEILESALRRLGIV